MQMFIGLEHVLTVPLMSVTMSITFQIKRVQLHNTGLKEHTV